MNPPNVFQRTILEWETIHPYNAAQVMRLHGPVNATRIVDSWNSVGEADLPRAEGVQLDTPRELSSPLETHLTAEMNRRFNSSDATLRPFYAAADDDSHYVGVVYRHCVADSFSIRELMRRWVGHRYGRPPSPRMKPATGGYWRHLGPSVVHWSPLRTAGDVVRWTPATKHVRRVESDDFADGEVRFRSATLAAGTLARVRAVAKSHGTTVNDVFLSAIASVCDRLQLNSPRAERRDLAIGTIHDLRAIARGVDNRVFGLFLGFTETLIHAATLVDPVERLHAIAMQSRDARKRNTAAASQFRFAANLVVAALLGHKPEKLVEFYRKRLPLAGGVSNVNLNATPLSPFIGGELIDYLRVSPTGPIMPLVFTPTTVGESIHVGLTVRAKLIDDATQGVLLKRFANELAAL